VDYGLQENYYPIMKPLNNPLQNKLKPINYEDRTSHQTTDNQECIPEPIHLYPAYSTNVHHLFYYRAKAMEQETA
jgi:hypothetical protein